MKPEEIDLIKYRLQKAHNTLEDARHYYGSATPASTVNRIYYALFYAVTALLMTKGLSSAKHSGVRSLFNREFVKQGAIDKDLGKFYSDMYDNRQESDYKDFVEFERAEVALWIDKAENFIHVIEGVVVRIMSG
ncbi:MAG: HEPN domain-containing protein [Proteobacteria bacterium]|nr:HEPN domain-containing protein [Pseudomonadota bacterium]